MTGTADGRNGHGPAPARDPSAMGHRRAAALLALLGATIAAYLAAFQVGSVTTPWEPLFGAGAERVLTSPVARLLPVPDAAVGAVAYLVEAALAIAGGPGRASRRPRLVLAYGAVAAALAATGVLLVGAQLALRAGCTLCLASAAISSVVAALAAPEVVAAWGAIRAGGSRSAPRTGRSTDGALGTARSTDGALGGPAQAGRQASAGGPSGQPAVGEPSGGPASAAAAPHMVAAEQRRSR